MDIDEKETIEAQVNLIDKIMSAEQRIENGEPYITIAELKAKLGV